MASLVKLVGHNLQTWASNILKGREKTKDFSYLTSFLPSGHMSYIHIAFFLGHRVNITE